MEKIPLDTIRLRFPDALEREFREDYYAKSLNQLRFGIILGTLLYALFGLLDAWITPEIRYRAWFVRYAVVLPACVSVLLFSLSSRFKQYMQVAVFSLVLVAGGGIVALIVIVPAPLHNFHSAGLLLVIMYSYTFSKLRFLHTSVASWTVVGIYEIAAIWIIHSPLQSLLTDDFFYIGANLLGMFSSYHRELYLRRDFFQSKLVRDLERKKHTKEKIRLHETVAKATQSLIESEGKFRSLAQTAAIAIFIHQGGNFLYANRAAEVIGGYTVEEYLSMHFLSLVHPDYLDLVKTRAHGRLEGGEAPPQYEFKLVRKNGDERWVLMTAGTMEYDGRPAVIGTLIDITTRKQAEEEREEYYRQLQRALLSLKESEARFRALAETTAAGMFIHRGGALIYVNPAGERITGYSREEMFSLNFWEIIHPDYRDLVRERGLARLAGQPVPTEYEFMMSTKDGSARWVSMTGGVFEYEERPAVIATIFDITDRKHAEEDRVRLYEERIAEEKKHLREKENILMDLHDGIGGITTNISILSELGKNTTDIEHVQKTLDTISRLSREGISEIRSFMHGLDSREMSWHSLAAELRTQGTGMLEQHKIVFQLDCAIDTAREQPSSLLWVTLCKIYKEALTNVIKHSQANAVTARIRVSERSLELTVQDNGIGGKAMRDGGRGLSNMRKRAEDVGGTFSVSSQEGTSVGLHIPLPIKYPVPGMDL